MNKIFICINLILLLIFFGSAAAAKIINIDIGHINNFFNEEKIIHILDTAAKDDIVRVYINSQGGVAYKAYKIIHAIERTKAQIHMYINQAYSAAALIATAGDKIYYKEDSYLMFHLVRTSDCLAYFLIGEYCILELDHTAQQRYLKYFNTYAKKFLTNAEYKAMLNGKDIYISGKQLEQRLK